MQTIDKRSQVIQMQMFYLIKEAKKGFKGWTKEGLEFLLKRDALEAGVERECKKAIVRLSQQNRYFQGGR